MSSVNKLFNQSIITVAMLTMVIPPLPARADRLNEIFNSLNGTVNVTPAGAYKAQGSNIYVGGSVSARVSPRNYQIANITPPSLKYGCGGIDAHLGSFSFISKDELVAMLKDIGKGAVSYAFDLGLKAISPDIAETLKSLQRMAQAANAMNINSCETGRALAQGLVKGDWNALQTETASITGGISSVFSDYNESRQRTNKDEGAQANALRSAPAEIKEKVAPGNIVWKALKKANVPNEDAELMMSMIGSVVTPKIDGTPDAEMRNTPDYWPDKGLDLQTFMYGNEASNIPVYSCGGANAEGCLSRVEAFRPILPYTTQVRTRLEAIATKLSQRNTALTDDEKSFVGATSLPIYKALSVFTSVPNADISQAFIVRYSEYIAASYAATFIRIISKETRSALGSMNEKTNGPTKDALTRVLERLTEVERQAESQLQTLYARSNGDNKIVDEIMRTERSIYNSLPKSFQANLAFRQ